jgi:hypothetical protein
MEKVEKVEKVEITRDLDPGSPGSKSRSEPTTFVQSMFIHVLSSIDGNKRCNPPCDSMDSAMAL